MESKKPPGSKLHGGFRDLILSPLSDQLSRGTHPLSLSFRAKIPSAIHQLLLKRSYWLCARRLEEGTFRWPTMEGTCARYRREELLLLLGGIDLKQTQARKWYRREVEMK